MKTEWPKRATMYVHGTKESAYEKGAELGLSEEALKKFTYALYEVVFNLDVNEDGTYKIIDARE